MTRVAREARRASSADDGGARFDDRSRDSNLFTREPVRACIRSAIFHGLG